MKWQAERDILIAQTMAFVQSVAGKTTEAQGRLEAIPANKPAEMERQTRVVAVVCAPPARNSELREEIRGRVAAFRAHQALFNRDRDEYCDSILAKVRAATERLAKVPESQPIRR
jgi:hypothetical protein